MYDTRFRQVCQVCSNKANMGTYANPIIAGFNPDPSIVRVNEDYFLVTSSFEYFPGVPIYHSTDLIGWKLIGHALTRTSQYQMQSPEPGGGIWAPTLRYHHGVFYIATANFTRYRPQQDDRLLPRGFYVCTKNIWDDSSWSDAVYFDQIGFDQDVRISSIHAFIFSSLILFPQAHKRKTSKKRW